MGKVRQACVEKPDSGQIGRFHLEESFAAQMSAYHEASKHHYRTYAPGPGYLDWATQPDPFRRYAGAQVIPLARPAPDDDLPYEAGFMPGQAPVALLDAASVSRLFFDTLAISAWKEYDGERWALRINPSSGNLHPTEGYLLAGPIAGLLAEPALCHYAPLEHGLEVRRDLPAELWQEVVGQLPPGAFLIGLTSIYWRESWKYGERAFRYCMHDVGHAIAAVAIAAAVLGWEARLLESVADRELAILLGVHDQAGSEAEHPDCLLALYPPARSSGFSRSGSEATEVATTNVADFRLTPALLDALASIPPAGPTPSAPNTTTGQSSTPSPKPPHVTPRHPPPTGTPFRLRIPHSAFLIPHFPPPARSSANAAARWRWTA